jgi:hypothetical protein
MTTRAANLLAAAAALALAAAARADTIFTDGFESGLCTWSAVSPSPVEICDAIDNDCDLAVDEGCSYCSPVDPEPLCGASSHCTPETDGDSICSHPAGVFTQGQACLSLADCAEPYACLDTGSGTRCLHWCQLPAGICPVGLTCLALNPPVFTGATEWGVCL